MVLRLLVAQILSGHLELIQLDELARCIVQEPIQFCHNQLSKLSCRRAHKLADNMGKCAYSSYDGLIHCGRFRWTYTESRARQCPRASQHGSWILGYYCHDQAYQAYLYLLLFSQHYQVKIQSVETVAYSILGYDIKDSGFSHLLTWWPAVY